MLINPNLHNPEFEGRPFHLKANQNKAVLLLHGLTATPFEVHALGRQLHQAGYTTAAPVLPGHGDEPNALNRVSWQDWYTACDAALSDLCASHAQVYVGGESTGALLALLLAARNPNLAGILAYAPALKLPLNFFQHLQLKLLARFDISVPKRDLKDNTTWQGYRVNPIKGVLQLVALQEIIKKELITIQQPILLIQGLEDKTIDLRSAQMVYDGVLSSHKEIFWMENSGHCVLLDDEVETVTNLTLNFLARVEARARDGSSTAAAPNPELVGL